MTSAIAREDGRRAWCAVFQFPGKEPLTFGTVFARLDAPMQEVETACYAALDRYLPTRPKIVRLVPGMVLFVPEDG